jgi:hypothetical protein
MLNNSKKQAESMKMEEVRYSVTPVNYRISHTIVLFVVTAATSSNSKEVL